MDRRTWLANFEQSPASVQEYLLDTKESKNESIAQDKLSYDNDAWDRVMDVVWDLVFTNLARQEFRDRIKALAGDRKPEDVERAVLFYVVLPLADLVFWDVEGRLQELGMSMGDIQAIPRISLRPVSYGAGVRRIASQAKLSILAEEMLRRLRELFISYIKGVRTIEQMKEMLQRSQGDGGIGLSKDQADQFCETMVAFLFTTQVLSEQEYADWLTSKQRESETRNADRGMPDSRAPGSELGDEEEVKATAASGPTGERMMIDEVVEQTMQQIALPQLEEYIQKRLRNVISTRLRDVRSAIQTKSILEREAKVGGVELSAEQVERVASIIEQMYTGHRIPIEEEEKKRIDETLAAQQTKVEERKKRESEEHAKWFQEKIQQVRPEELLRKQFEAAKAMAMNPAAVPPQATNVPPPKPLNVDTIQAPVKLVGLGEELAGITLAEFRRLSKDPNQAIEKLRQKFETLKNESFDRWTEGIEAWRQSPLQKQYLTLVAQSFAAGKPVAELVVEKRAKDPSLPTPEELSAIIKLNSEIQF
ncbi:hypothetical protein FJZ48_00445 [Candidatus Uhrbacteria bacterium]|nr:hypothetical protein [Candidatus Uhrbacteria bacterium]